MAKNDPTKKEEPWWLALLAGIVVLGGAVYVFYDLTQFEAEGGTRRMNAIYALLYNYLGKWGIVGLMAVGGLGAILHGLSQVLGGEAEADRPTTRKKKRRESDE